MSERKVLNKYYPPDFDASKLPRVKRDKNRQFTIRLMAPFNMRCKTCGEYIYRGKKFNARKEDVIGKTYLGIQIYRFYIKCTKCLAEITFLTDPESQDYEMENGAIRNFECIRLAEKQADTEAKQKKEEEANNPMKILENRTRDSRREMAVLETLEDLRELNAAHAGIDPKVIIQAEEEYKKQLEILQAEEDEEELKRILSSKRSFNSNETVDETVTSNKSIKSEKSAQEETKSKKQKTDETIVKTEPNKSVLFKKPAQPQSAQTKSEISQSNKLKLSLFIKKNTTPIKSEPIDNDDSLSKPVPASLATSATNSNSDSKQANQPPSSLLNLISAYDNSSSEDE